MSQAKEEEEEEEEEEAGCRIGSGMTEEVAVFEDLYGNRWDLIGR